MSKKENVTNQVTTPFDDVLRTILEHIPYIMIPLINEAFDRHYNQSDSIVMYKNEHVFLNQKVASFRVSHGRERIS